MDPSRIISVPYDDYQRILGRDVSKYFSVIVLLGEEPASAPKFCIAHADPRCFAAMHYADFLLSRASAEAFADRRSGNAFILQADDCPSDQYSIGWARKAHYNRVCVLPELYYVENRGYQHSLPGGVLPWSDRNDSISWRGSTTGRLEITSDTLEDVPRYRLCKISQQLGARNDLGITSVVQARSDDETLKIMHRLDRENLLVPVIDLEALQVNKYMVHIDGNANSWGLVRKLRIGCCPIIVDSPWLMWHSEGLRPWEHFVPVREDLSDFLDKAEWCFSNDNEAARIAQRARDFALSLDFEDEMRSSCERLYPYLEFIEVPDRA